jgi:holo-[acyl-carrier protein] synthase
MIKGIGVDIVEIGRIEGMIARYGGHFLDKIFTEAEKGYCGKMANPPVHYAGRWAAKEAFYKALPKECQALSGWKSMEVVCAGRSAPSIAVRDAPLRARMKKCGVGACHLSISHEKTVCIAMAVLDRK